MKSVLAVLLLAAFAAAQDSQSISQSYDKNSQVTVQSDHRSNADFVAQKDADRDLVVHAFECLRNCSATPIDYKLEFYGGGSSVDGSSFTMLRYDQFLDAASTAVTYAIEGNKVRLTFAPQSTYELTPVSMPEFLAVIEKANQKKYTRFVRYSVTIYHDNTSFKVKSFALLSDEGNAYDSLYLADTAGIGEAVLAAVRWQRDHAENPDNSRDGAGRNGGTVITDCSWYDDPGSTASLFASNTLHHSSGSHGGTGTAVESCIYVDTQKIDGAACKVTSTTTPASPSFYENGTITDLTGHHAEGSVNGTSATANANGGAVTTTAYAGLAVESCVSCLLKVTLSNGIVTVTPSPALWTWTYNFSKTCVAETYQVTCGSGGNKDGPRESCSSPLAVDVRHEGFHFTGLDQCKMFDLNGDGKQECVAWLDPAWHTMFLTLGEDVTNGRKLFGSFSYSHYRRKNGWTSLRMYDANHDDAITPADPVWSKLRLWDAQGHYQTLDQAGVTYIPLTYVEKDVTDDHGNVEKLWGGTDAVPMVDVWLQVRR
jgi:hypothetical protein